MVTQNPLDGVHDIALSAPVRPYNTGDSRCKVKTGAVGETLESKEFERLEHETESLVCLPDPAGKSVHLIQLAVRVVLSLSGHPTQ